MSPRVDAAVRRLVLPGLRANSIGAWFTLAAVAAVLLSRLLLLPDGPWEQDEALFAAGVLDFDITRHRPHPPGFPGWIGIGKLLLPVFRDPMLALQVASAVGSTAMFWALARLLDRLLPGGRATLLAAAFTMSPLVWIHSGRAFSTTPAVACGVLAMLAWRGGPRAHLWAWALLALAALIRPQLLPELVVLSIAALASDGPSRRLKLGGLVLAFTLGLLGLSLAFATNADAVAQAFVDHLGRHRSGLDTTTAWAELGVVRGLGHPAIAAALAGLAAAGLWRAIRIDRRQGAWLAGLIGVTAWMILRQHHPGFPRYAVALLAACLPALAWGIESLSRRLGMLLVFGLTILGAVSSLGPLLSMHSAPLPVVAAARIAAADPDAAALAYSHGVFSFSRLEAERAGLAAFDVTAVKDMPSRCLLYTSDAA
ncbi:MAG: hypothetical protein KUG77_11465, partial [Nannocystaceae bacterium]|nr:hypothetical protein [Nannocystaceae bacterium]